MVSVLVPVGTHGSDTGRYYGCMARGGLQCRMGTPHFLRLCLETESRTRKIYYLREARGGTALCSMCPNGGQQLGVFVAGTDILEGSGVPPGTPRGSRGRAGDVVPRHWLHT